MLELNAGAEFASELIPLTCSEFVPLLNTWVSEIRVQLSSCFCLFGDAKSASQLVLLSSSEHVPLLSTGASEIMQSSSWSCFSGVKKFASKLDLTCSKHVPQHWSFRNKSAVVFMLPLD